MTEQWGSEIRVAVGADARGIAEVHVRAWQEGYRGLVPQAHLDALDVERRATWWTQIIERPSVQGQRTWVTSEGGRVNGFATAGHTRDADDDASRVGELQAIYVAPKAWRRGAGSVLVEQVDAFLVSQGCEEVTVWVLEGNARGSAFYEKHGWHPDGAAKLDVWDGTELHEIRFRRSLRSPGR